MMETRRFVKRNRLYRLYPRSIGNMVRKRYKSRTRCIRDFIKSIM